jgi:UDP-glucose:glycoprotein glucosyltransferase
LKFLKNFDQVSKKADKINESLLEDKDSEKESSIWESIASKFSGSASDLVENKDQENVLNIFSLASGHLYERLMRFKFLFASFIKRN